MPRAIQIHPADNVLVALEPIAVGETVEGVNVINAIPPGHKIALRAIDSGDFVIKYGYSIGVAKMPIAAGSHVHSHNLRSALSDHLDAMKFIQAAPRNGVPNRKSETFDGYRRADGRAATRNEIWIVNTVGCVNHVSERVAAAAHMRWAGKGVDGVYAFPHPFGCSQLGDDLSHTQRVLGGLANHPNAAAVLVLGLGCENNRMQSFLAQLGPMASERIRYFNAQDVGDEVAAGATAVDELAAYASQFRREPIDVSELVLGMKCGGSDGFSGITANPMVGKISDRLAAAGGTVLLSEVPEMFGAEKVLLDRAADETTFKRTIDLVNDFRGYFRRYNEPIDENPSPGNIDGGITTLAEKSLGCVQKGGHATVKAVLAYGERAPAKLGGLALVNAPGNDGVSSTAMTVAGALEILFTTGRGTPMGFPAPTLKIASNKSLADRKPGWIDFSADAGAKEDDLWQLVLDVASGRKQTRNEANGFREIAIWKDGVTL